ncbi:GNAT family N-acetyltransferase [Nocardiopsis tropica]|uniref:GNAT family N-acetyltransferase n=1 Tax=Nocardiopsis tropica TaxID=109330 RepID=A0ABU7KQU6_9ACTN|nr:GNAT family N-acetyltransferase [Nocardiopsis umidischolae]MEE2051658.1 GNAT family N-acetyltransferase [Nocardiopsis umidischolae]
MLFRRALPEDGPHIAALVAAAAPSFGAKHSGAVALVAVDAGALVGWIEGVLDGAYTGPGAPAPPPHGYVLSLVVDAAWRRQGVGTGLLDAFVDEAREVGLAWVFLFPDEGEDVEGRVRFFEQAGFEAVDDPAEQWPAMGMWAQDAR